MDWKPNSSRLFCNCSGDALPNPPISISAKFVATTRIKLLDTTYEPKRAFLDDVQKFHVALGVLLSDANDESEIGRNHLFFCLFAITEFSTKFFCCQAKCFG